MYVWIWSKDETYCNYDTQIAVKYELVNKGLNVIRLVSGLSHGYDTCYMCTRDVNMSINESKITTIVGECC